MPFMSPNPLLMPTPTRNVLLSYDPAPTPDKLFFISEECAMPSIVVTATMSDDLVIATRAGAVKAAGLPGLFGKELFAAAARQECSPLLTYSWDVTLTFDGFNCPHAVGDGAHTAHAPIKVVTKDNQFRIPFSQVRGGDLTISVVITGPGFQAKASSEGLKVLGKNPRHGWAVQQVPALSVLFRKLMHLESFGRQFITNGPGKGLPLFNTGGDGGVGICQITPPDNDTQVWSWKANLAKGLDVWNDTKKRSDAYYKDVRESKKVVKNTNLDVFVPFNQMVKAYNDARQKKNPPAPH